MLRVNFYNLSANRLNIESQNFDREWQVLSVPNNIIKKRGRAQIDSSIYIRACLINISFFTHFNPILRIRLKKIGKNISLLCEFFFEQLNPRKS